MTDSPSPGDDLELFLIDLWAGILAEYHPDGRPERISPDDDFFDVGGSSLLGMMLISRIYDELEVELPFSVLLERPTIRALAERILRSLVEDAESGR